MNSHYRMLLFHGFDDSNDRLKCPPNLKIALRTCIKSHARSLPDLKNKGLFPNDVLSEPISWDSACQFHEKLHGVSSSERIDFRCHMYSLQLTQGLYRQELCGKTMLPCLAVSLDGDMVVINIAGGREIRKENIHMESGLHATVAKHTIVSQLRSRVIFSPDNPMIAACIFI